MILAGIMAGVGVLCLVFAILLLRLKKLPLRWGISLLVCALLVGGAGGTLLLRQVQSRGENNGNVYLALLYLEQGQTDPAALYLKRVTDSSSYHLLAAQTLLEQARGNTTVAQLRLAQLESIQNGSDNQTDAIALLQTWQQEEDGLAQAAKKLRRQIPLSDAQEEELELRFEAETGANEGSLRDYRDTAGEEAGLRMEIDRALGLEDWNTALDCAIDLVDQSASASNRLLLAQVIADVTYSDTPISTDQFTPYADAEEDTQAQEYEDLIDRYDSLQRRIQALETEGGEDEEHLERAQALREEAEEVQVQAQNIFALRAFSSIADLHSLEAQVVRARLYFAMHHEQEAVELLCDSAQSVQSLFSTNDALVNSLGLVRQAYESESAVGVDTPEFREEMRVLLGSVHPEVIHLGLTPLATDLTEQIVTDQKRYGSGLYVVHLDHSQYPQITVTLSGQDTVMERLTKREGIVVHDTRSEISDYTVTAVADGVEQSSICFVVDTSGSMDGSPIQDAREALLQFLDQSTGGTELSLVEFNDGASVLVERTDSVNQMKNGVSSLGTGGGTNITAGISAGADALRGSAGARNLVVMTDGQSDIDWDTVRQAVEEDITIFTIGFGDVNDELLQNIADMSGGQYLRAESSAELVNVYNSLQGIIGNTVTVTYTVTEGTEESYRYFYLQDSTSSLSVRREYVLNEEAAPTPAVTVTSAPILLTREDLDRRLERQETAVSVRLEGTNLDQVAGVQVGQLSCVVADAQTERLTLELPVQLPSGVYDLTLTTQSGESVQLSQMVWVGSQVDCRSYRCGCLELSANGAILLPDGRLALGSEVSFWDVPATEEQMRTLSMSLRGVLTVSGVNLTAYRTPEGNLPNQITLGQSGQLQGYGVLRLESGDWAYESGVSPKILSGLMSIDYTAQEAKIAASEVSAP